MEIFYDEFKEFWPISEFLDIYTDLKTGYAVASLSSDFGDNPDNTSIVILRAAIEDSKELHTKGQKYILCMKSYNFGDIIVIDLISLNRPHHRDIVLEYILRRGSSISFDPFLFVGGSILLQNGNWIISGESGEYGISLFGENGNEIAKYIVEVCFQQEERNQHGKIFVEKILTFSLANKRKKDFYEKLAEKMYEFSSVTNQQHLSALFMMKVMDRAIEEKHDILKIMSEELTEGFGRHVMIAGVAEALRRRKN